MSLVDVREAITQAHHEEWARVVAALTRRFGDLDIAEEALEALLSVDRDLVRQDLEDAETFLAQFGDRLPARIGEELRATRERLSL